MKYYRNDENDLTVFRDIFGAAWEKAADMNDQIGAFLLLDKFGRAVLDVNAARFFGIAEGENPVYNELKELVAAAENSTADNIEITLLNYCEDVTAGFVKLAEDDPLHEIHYRLCSQKEFAESAACSPKAVIMMIAVEGDLGSGEEFDSCIFSAADAMISKLPDDALMTRFSENEFRLCLPNGIDDPKGFARTLAEAVHGCTIHNPLGTVINLTRPLDLSVGICGGSSAAAYKMHGAEFALFEARASNNSPIKVFNPEKYESRKAEYDSVMKFSRLINENLFIYHFQPIVSAATGKIVAYEALMRSDPSIGYGPLEILDIAAKRGRLYDIELATMRNTLAALSENQSFFDERKLFINSITSQLLNKEDYNALIADYGELLEKTVVEFTEHSEVSDDELKAIKERLAEGKMQLAIDDYGTGYSNTANLVRYSPDYVKIDRSLISGIENDIKRQTLVSGLIDFIHSTGCMALAEGVETFEEVRTVINLSVDLLQGFYVSRPKPVLLNEISESIREEIVRINLEAQCRIQKIYRASDGDTLNLSLLALEKYTDIFIDGGKITLVGDSDVSRHVKMPVTVKENAVCEITMRSVFIEPEPDIPALTLSKGSRVRLVCECDNVLEKSMILVPETAELLISGTGNLSVNAEQQDCYGIGNNHTSGFGNIYIDMDGMLNVLVNGENAIGIGGGRNGTVNIEAGTIQVTVNCSNGVCIGAFEGNAYVNMHDCSLCVTAAAASTVCVGSLQADAEIHLANIAAELFAQGNNLCGAGSLGGSLVFEARDMSFSTELRGRQIINVGTSSSRCNCSIEHAEVNIYSEGHTVTGIGDRTGSGEIKINSSEVNVRFLSGDSKVIVCPKGNIDLENVVKTVKLNE